MMAQNTKYRSKEREPRPENPSSPSGSSPPMESWWGPGPMKLEMTDMGKTIGQLMQERLSAGLSTKRLVSGSTDSTKGIGSGVSTKESSRGCKEGPFEGLHGWCRLCKLDRWAPWLPALCPVCHWPIVKFGHPDTGVSSNGQGNSVLTDKSGFNSRHPFHPSKISENPITKR